MSELNLILIGPPGAGKGTQAKYLTDDFDLPYLATGDMMRAKRKEDSDLGREIDRIINEGGLVDDGVVCEVLLERIEAEGDDGFLLDGFPRTLHQADILQGALSKRGRSLTAVLLIDTPDELILERIEGRRQQEGRDDDAPETVKKRLDTYHEQTEPLVERYDDEGLLRRFDGSGTPDEVHEHIRKTVRTLARESDV